MILVTYQYVNCANLQIKKENLSLLMNVPWILERALSNIYECTKKDVSMYRLLLGIFVIN